MSAADELRAEIDKALDLDERSVAHATALIQALQQLTAQTVLFEVTNSEHPGLSSITSELYHSLNEANAIVPKLSNIHRLLSEWRNVL